MAITGTRQVELRWSRADGRALKSVPSAVKTDAAEAYQGLKQEVKNIQKLLPAQRDRLERLLMSRREWTFKQWRERYRDHPLLANLSRRLIWLFGPADAPASPGALGCWLNGAFVDENDHPLEGLREDTTVRPWHPIGFRMETIVAWREFLERHEIAQPFKQAHREVYILTEAERQTSTYSNRFAAHIVRMQQLAALAQQRNWVADTLVVYDPTYDRIADPQIRSQIEPV